MKIYKKSEKLSNKLRKMISWVFVIIGILVVSVGAVLTVLLENMLIVLIPTLGVSFIVSGITGLVTKNVEEFNSKEKVVEETLKRILENPEAIEGLKENNTTYAYGLTEIYKNNLQMVKKCIDRKIPYYVYAVDGELDNPDKNISELLKQTISTMDSLCSSRNRIIRLQVKNAPVKWLIEMSKLMKKHPENFEMKLTDEAPFISQILIAGNEELGIIPTETQLQKSYGEFYRRSPTEKIEPDRDIITTHHNYIMGKFNKIPTITVEEIEEEINKLIIERKNLLSCLIGLFYLFHGTIRDKSLLDKFAFTDGNWTVKVNDFKKELLERIEDEEYSTTDKFQQDDKDLELIFDTSLLVNKHIRDIVNQTDLHLFKEILVKAMKKEEEMIFQEYSRKTKEEIRSFILTWTKDLEKELTWQP